MSTSERYADHLDRSHAGSGNDPVGDTLSALRSIGEQLLSAAGQALRPRSPEEAVEYLGSAAQAKGQ